LSFYENSKNIRNSSIPASQDENRPKPNQSLRKKSGEKPGGQLGREGKTLEMTATPDKVIELHPDYCINCGSSLEDSRSIKAQSRQIIDISPIKAVFTEYQAFRKMCLCGCSNLANFLKEVTCPVFYGSTIESLIGYFHARQYLPFVRMQEVFNANIREGGIHYLLKRVADKTTPIYKLIKGGVKRVPLSEQMKQG
jgi:transposase